ncbi:manganese/iron ABC transporter ATP-binding protein [Paracoccus spongiarum]|uniref:Manganese/iron ABC transporter ATP-binding protein n=1 Tax=Paracoccus spongiarum TaxID=3064387 RepID=A0ABT9JE98_9RHOB|nr:manganese/iron ABC transporter ATP-binding protein [Paracoccus sp. 2205BS29-5]MDP5308154.1 manganese/iron ABC transporter ATP-binding protein [Paracoccus sp. 2205BS29-5]
MTEAATSPPAPPDGIAVSGLTVTYRSGRTALRDASLTVPQRLVTALVGVNGAGKSTLFKALMGCIPGARGHVRILGHEVDAALAANLVAHVAQAEEVDWTFPVLVEDVVMMGRYGHMGFLRRPRPADREAVSRALARMNMTGVRTRQIGELAGGQKKRVVLARALAQDARVILFDEPFTGVDVQTEEAIIALLREMRAEGRVMLVSTHDLGSVPEYCDRVVMVKGTVLASGPTETTFTPANLRRAFGGVLRHFVLGGRDLHDDPDSRSVDVFTDDERPLIFHDDRHRTREGH